MDTYYRNRFHLKNDLLEGDVKIVTYEVWASLCAWYGGGPPLPATIVLCNDGESGQERESSEVNYIRNRMSTNSMAIVSTSTSTKSLPAVRASMGTNYLISNYVEEWRNVFLKKSTIRYLIPKDQI